MRNRVFLLKLSVAVLISVLLIRYLNLSEAWLILRRVQIHYLVIVFLIVNADRVLMAYKWKILLKAKRLDSSLFSLIRVYYLSVILAPVLPSTIGEDVVRGVAVEKTGIGSHNIISSIVVERILGTLSLFLLAFLSLGFFVLREHRYFGHLLIYGAVFLVLLSAAFYYSLTKNVFSGSVYNKLSGSSSRTLSFFGKIYLSYMDYKYCKKHLLIFFFLSIIEHIIIVYMNYLIIKSLGFRISFLSTVYTIPTIMFLSRLPISIGQIGVQEGAFVVLLSLVGLTLTDSVTISVVKRAIIYLSVLPGQLLFYGARWRAALGPLSAAEDKSPEGR